MHRKKRFRSPNSLTWLGLTRGTSFQTLSHEYPRGPPSSKYPETAMLNFHMNMASEHVHCATRALTISSGRCLSSVISEISVNFFHQKEGKISNSTGEPSQRKWHRWLRKQLHVLISRVGRIESHAIRRENSVTKIDRDVSVTSNVNKILRIRPKLKIRKKVKNIK